MQPADVEEDESGEPRELVCANALRKARAVAAGAGDRTVLGVDTAVFVGERSYGKPNDEREARAHLEALSGRTHDVWSGVALIDGAGERVEAIRSSVTFRSLDDRTISWYVASGEWRERAGGYAIQGRGAALVSAIDGDYSNVVGLPVPLLADMAPELLFSPAVEA